MTLLRHIKIFDLFSFFDFKEFVNVVIQYRFYELRGPEPENISVMCGAFVFVSLGNFLSVRAFFCEKRGAPNIEQMRRARGPGLWPLRHPLKPPLL